MQIVNSIEISAPRDRVFELLADIPNAAENISAIETIEMLSDGPVGVGTRWREMRKMMGKEATEEMWIVDFNPAASYSVEAESHGMQYRTDIVFEATGENSTLVKQTFAGKPVTLAAKLFTPIGWLFKGPTKKALQKDLVELKQKLES